MKRSWWAMWWAVALAALLLGCQKAAPTPTPDPALSGEGTGVFGGLGDANTLALGTLRLEGTAQAVGAAQAAQLLPLWQMVGSGSLQVAAETEAVLRQIEGLMTAEQIAAIEAMALSFEDIGAWMEAQGIEMPQRTGAGPDGGPGGGPGGGQFQNLSEDERAAMREQFQNMTTEERATRAAEMGFQRPEGQEGGFAPGARPDGRMQGGSLLVQPLIELLTERAGE